MARELSRYFKTFHASRTIEPEAQVYFVEDASEYSLPAIMEAITKFRTGRVADRNDDFAPSVATFVKEVRACQDRIDVAEFWDKTDFVLVDSAEWNGMCEARGLKSMPAVEYKGPRGELRGSFGWYVAKDEVKRAAPLIVKHRKEMLRLEKRGPLRLPGATT